MVPHSNLVEHVNCIIKMPKIDNMVFVEQDDITGLVDLVCLFCLVDPGDLLLMAPLPMLAILTSTYFSI